MAEPLKNYFDARVPRTIAGQISSAFPEFPSDSFLVEVLDGYDDLGLMDRGRHIARVLQRYLPPRYPDAINILLKSAGERPIRGGGDGGMASFLYLPHVNFVAEFGLEHFDVSMRALYVFTQLFTAEFSIRPFLERYESESLVLLRDWTADPNWHIRRLVSEGTRTRLPWASRLPRFQKDPTPVLALLELLKDDVDSNVRRSVANNLNDIGKDHPDVLVEVAGRWLRDASEERSALVKHALRSLVKQGHPAALKLLGFGRAATVAVEDVSITPARLSKGGKVTICFTLRSTASRAQQVLADLRVHFLKANGKASPKVFKLKAVNLPPGGKASCRNTISLADLTTRKHYAGEHQVEAMLNGAPFPLGCFLLEE